MGDLDTVRYRDFAETMANILIKSQKRVKHFSLHRVFMHSAVLHKDRDLSADLIIKPSKHTTFLDALGALSSLSTKESSPIRRIQQEERKPVNFATLVQRKNIEQDLDIFVSSKLKSLSIPQ